MCNRRCTHCGIPLRLVFRIFMIHPSRLAINSSSQGSLSLQRACAANLTALAFGTAFSYATKMAKHLRSSERIRSHQHHIRTASARYTFQLLLYANLQSKSLPHMPPCEHALRMILVLHLHALWVAGKSSKRCPAGYGGDKRWQRQF